jgi:hypothetical protein
MTAIARKRCKVTNYLSDTQVNNEIFIEISLHVPFFD